MGRVVKPLLMSSHSLDVKKLVNHFKEHMIQSQFLE